jgi:hypothetical protein
VNSVGVIESRAIAIGDGEGGRFGQCGTYVTSCSCAALMLDPLSSGSIVAGGMEAADIAEADALGGNLGWT